MADAAPSTTAVNDGGTSSARRSLRRGRRRFPADAFEFLRTATKSRLPVACKLRIDTALARFQDPIQGQSQAHELGQRSASWIAVASAVRYRVGCTGARLISPC